MTPLPQKDLASINLKLSKPKAACANAAVPSPSHIQREAEARELWDVTLHWASPPPLGAREMPLGRPASVPFLQTAPAGFGDAA